MQRKCCNRLKMKEILVIHFILEPYDREIRATKTKKMKLFELFEK